MTETYKEHTTKGALYEIILEPTTGRKQEVLAFHATVLLGRHYYIGKMGVGKDGSEEEIRNVLLEKARSLAEEIAERPTLESLCDLMLDWK